MLATKAFSAGVWLKIRGAAEFRVYRVACSLGFRVKAALNPKPISESNSVQVRLCQSRAGSLLGPVLLLSLAAQLCTY